MQPVLLKIFKFLQYLVIPLLSLSIMAVGSHKLGKCPGQPNLPVWHIVAGASGLLAPLLYLCFDEVNIWMDQRLPKVSNSPRSFGGVDRAPSSSDALGSEFEPQSLGFFTTKPKGFP